MLAGSPPCLRIQGDVEQIKYHELSADELMDMLAEIAPEHKLKEFEETGDVDFAYELPDVSRFRANFFRQLHGPAAVFRQIPARIMTIDQLGLPPRAALRDAGEGTGSGHRTDGERQIDDARRDHRLR